MRKALKRYVKETMTYNVAVLSVVLAGLLFALDYYNVISSVVGSVPQDIGIVAALLAVAIVLLLFFKHKLYDMFKAKIINALDKLAFLLPIAYVIYFLPYLLFINDHLYKLVLAPTLVIPAFIIIFKRACVIFITIENTKPSSTVKLKSVCRNEISYNKTPILISEKVDTTDLLERDFVVNNLLHSIKFCDYDSCSTIGLVGQWGSGKTTVIEIAKAKLKEDKHYLIIDNFEPWLYESQEALLASAYETILNTLGIRYSDRRLKQAVSALFSAVASGNPIYSFFDSIFHGSGDNVMSSLKNKIITALSCENKTIVFVMDNLDRTEKKNIISIFKFISIMLDCPRIVYLLAYDKKKLNALFEHQEEFEERYYEKIINLEIHIPDISIEVREELTKCCMCNLLSAYDSNVDLKEYRVLYKFLVASKLNIRQLKQYFNTVFPPTFTVETHLYNKDLLTILTIQFLSKELYDEIHHNGKYYISADLGTYDINYPTYASSEEENKERNEYISKLKTNYLSYFELLKTIFPVLKCKGDENGLRLDSDEYFNITDQCRICSGQYFDLYFSHASNKYVTMNDTIEEYISAIQTSLDFALYTRRIIESMPTDQHKEFTEKLFVYTHKIDNSGYYTLAVALFDCIHIFDDSMYFGILNARMRVEYIIFDFLTKCSDEILGQFFVRVERKYTHANIVRYIYHEFEEQEKSAKQSTKRKDKALICYKKLVDEIVNGKIDLYDDDYYHSGNIFGVLGSEAALTEETKALYKTVIIKPKNIYRILWDCTQKSIGTNGYGYRLSSETISSFFDDITLADELIAKRPPRSEDEQKVLDFYKSYRSSENSFEHSFSEGKALFFDTEFMPNL